MKRATKLAFLCFAFIVVLSVNIYTAFAQNITDEPFIAPSSSSGEETIRELEIIGKEAKKGERIFVIAKLGIGEARRLTNVRLMNTRLKLSTVGLNIEQIVIGEGERVKGEGRIEIYVGSRLRLIILAKRNKMPNLTCCEDYFPTVKRSRKKKF